MNKLIVALVLVGSLSIASASPRKLTTAYTLSGVATGASVVLIAGAFAFPPHSGDIYMPMLWTGLGTAVVTPSLGNLYANHWLNIGMGIRVAAGAFAAYTVATQRQDVRCDTVMSATCKEITNSGITMLGIAGLVFVGGAAYDFKTLPEEVDDYNARHRFQWAPVVTPSPTGAGAMLGVGGTF